MCKPSPCSDYINNYGLDGVSWIGCGEHIPYAMSQVSKENWCTCNHSDGSSSEFPPKAGTGSK
ncbi:hypothetical protein PACTADRAFT_15574 [Pachysolen tannophilus NRRL Y-2460]|uniref:Uncharacterized protein n=1 Tax=Pachysolen tannophilus NRRL Y-2460 TaxID=669874 RepID=A0A1E4TZA8_PACTA|nr:hypothetical protein PACTADRAFT_15574 [Pachysolen tannophilus NRRL Y-2460]